MSWHGNKKSTWGRGEKKIEKKRRPRSGRTSRRLWPAGREEQCLRQAGSLRAISSAGKSSRTTAPTLQQEKRNIPGIPVLTTVPFSQGKTNTVPPRRKKTNLPSRPAVRNIFTVPSRRGEIFLPSRPAEGKNIYRPVPPRKKTITVPSRRRKT